MKLGRTLLLLPLLALASGLHAQPSSPVPGKGMWIWQIWTAEGGNLTTVITKLKSLGVTWVVAKMADSDSYYNRSPKSLYNWANTYGGMDSVVSIFHANGIAFLGFQYVYGYPNWSVGPSEADVANMMLSVKGIDGLLVDAEIQYDTLKNRVSAAESYMDSIKVHHPQSFVALTSWARVVLHATFPWEAFLDRVDLNMPQTYWAARPVSPATELSRMSSDFTTYTQIWVSGGDTAADKPIEPIGQAEYFGYGNDVVAGDITNFSNLSQTTYGYQGISLWEYTQITHQYVWDEYAAAWPSTSVTDRAGVPVEAALFQNYPNPFNPKTVVSYSVPPTGRDLASGGAGGGQLPVASNVRLVVYDILGREVTVLVNQKQGPGTYSVEFSGQGLSSGVYFYTLTTGGFVETRKMVLLR